MAHLRFGRFGGRGFSEPKMFCNRSNRDRHPPTERRPAKRWPLDQVRTHGEKGTDPPFRGVPQWHSEAGEGRLRRSDRSPL